MEFFLVWAFFALLVGLVAARRGRNGIGWFLLALLFSPILMGILVLVLGPTAASLPQKDEAGNFITPETHVKCPDCRELVKRDARKCKHCGAALIPQ